MKDVKLSYNQLRRIMAIAISNKTIKAKIGDFLGGKLTNISELELLELINESEADKELIGIISGKDPEKLDALEGLEYIAAFFGYIRANKAKYKGWLASLGLAVASGENTPGNDLK